MPRHSSARVDPGEQNPDLSPPPSAGEGVEDASTGLLLPAVRGGRIQEVLDALRRGAKPDERASKWASDDFPRGLQEAAARGNANICEVLLNAGADVDRSVGKGYTALDYAVFSGHYRCAEVLMRHGANPEKVNGEGQTAQGVAQRRSDAKMQSILASSSRSSAANA